MNNVELEYEKLLSNDAIDLSVLNHPMFRDSFIFEYERLSREGKCPVSVSFDGLGISLFSSQDLPSATNGVYQGYKSIDSAYFYIQNRHDNDYFCIRRKNSDVYSYLNAADNFGYSEALDVYLDNENVGKIELSSRYDCMQATIPNFAVNHYDIDLGCALNGDIPANIGSYTGNIVCNAIGKMPGIGYANTARYSRMNGNVESTYGLAAVNLETPYLLNTGDVNFAELKNNEMILISNEYSNIEDAKAFIQAEYDKKLGSRIL